MRKLPQRNVTPIIKSRNLATNLFQIVRLYILDEHFLFSETVNILVILLHAESTEQKQRIREKVEFLFDGKAKSLYDVCLLSIILLLVTGVFEFTKKWCCVVWEFSQSINGLNELRKLACISVHSSIEVAICTCLSKRPNAYILPSDYR